MLFVVTLHDACLVMTRCCLGTFLTGQVNGFWMMWWLLPRLWLTSSGGQNTVLQHYICCLLLCRSSDREAQSAVTGIVVRQLAATVVRLISVEVWKGETWVSMSRLKHVAITPGEWRYASYTLQQSTVSSSTVCRSTIYSLQLDQSFVTILFLDPISVSVAKFSGKQLPTNCQAWRILVMLHSAYLHARDFLARQTRWLSFDSIVQALWATT
jgi:hypothetical protein